MISSEPTSADKELRLVTTILVAGRDTFGSVRGVLRTADFIDPLSKWIWRQMQSIDDQGGNVANLDRYLDACRGGGPVAWGELARTVGRAANNFACLALDVEWYAKEVKRDSIRRQLQNLLEGGLTSNGDASETIRRLQDDLQRLETAAADVVEPGNVFDALQEINRQDDAASKLTVPTGYGFLDRCMMGGLRAGTVNVIAARPGGGKSAFAQCMAGRISKAGRSVLMISLEMTSSDVFARMLSQASEVPYAKIAKKNLTDAESERVERAAESLSRVRVHDRPLDHTTDIYSLVERYRPSVLMIDYLGLLPIDRRRDRREQIENNSNVIQQMAMKYNLPIVLLAQLNRDNAKDGKSPQLHNLRDTGAIEQDAYSASFIHGSDDAMGQGGAVEFILRKNRNGRRGTSNLAWRPECMRFDAQDDAANVTEYIDSFDDWG